MAQKEPLKSTPSTAAKATMRSAKLFSLFIHWTAQLAFSATAGIVSMALKT